MKRRIHLTTVLLLLLLAAGLAGIYVTRDTGTEPGGGRSAPSSRNNPASLVDQRPLLTAQKLAPLAVTHREQTFSAEALRLADRAVDLAFTAALRSAEAHPAPLSAEARALQERAKALQSKVQQRQEEIARLTDLSQKARGSQKDSLDTQLQLQRAELELDKDQLDDAQNDFIRAGGDLPTALVQLRQQHEASAQAMNGAATVDPAAAAAELNRASSVLAQFSAWNSLHGKRLLLEKARQQALDRAALVTARHNELEQTVQQESAAKSELSQKARTSLQAGAAEGSDQTTAALAAVKRLVSDQQTLAEFDQSIEDQQALAEVYDKWNAYAADRQRTRLHNLLLDFCLIVILFLVTLAGQILSRRLFERLALDRRRTHTLMAIARFALLSVCLFLMILVIFGSPTQLGTILALAGAGLTVALKDFIVGFFGWFVLMGREGIRPGDWVEINGVGGEVIEVGLLHTILLETGNFSDAGHPTGRKVTFNNSFAIEGHYFNFSTTGQWLWDQIEVVLPQDADPYPMAAAMQKIVAEETRSNARMAEEEWERVSTIPDRKPFSAEPLMTIRPVQLGVSVTVHYITRAEERSAARTHLYRAIVDLMQQRNVAGKTAEVKP